MSSSKSLSTISFPKPWSAPAGSGISCSPVSGSPKLASGGTEAWNCHQFHGATEFFADFGVYDVKITVPQFEVVGATGLEVDNVDNPDGTRSVTYHADDVHDFAWTASPHYRCTKTRLSAAWVP